MKKVIQLQLVSEQYFYAASIDEILDNLDHFDGERLVTKNTYDIFFNFYHSFEGKTQDEFVQDELSYAYAIGSYMIEFKNTPGYHALFN